MWQAATILTLTAGLHPRDDQRLQTLQTHLGSDLDISVDHQFAMVSRVTNVARVEHQLPFVVDVLSDPRNCGIRRRMEVQEQQVDLDQSDRRRMADVRDCLVLPGG